MGINGNLHAHNIFFVLAPFQMNSQMIINPEVLPQYYIPEKLLHREEEPTQLSKASTSSTLCLWREWFWQNSYD